ncbi:hypothetical protein SB49_10875 [Sediminicola sp. YIK13]|nr:hypothetical protein SB49_10875 [Sediminicola sp. YIK13]
MMKFTVLKGFSLLFILGCLLFTMVKWSTLSYEEGWGVVGMIGLISLGLAGLILDFVLTKLIKNKWLLNLIELLVLFFFSIELWISIKST